ncbi:protein MpLEA-like4 [Marchantia polymorpha subsp. ruderalis]|uniref:Water stress and hypersensitive response domain-containing protein n=2 Tax=Marchantia polymorpha TaxID=3197 RepID=A0A176VVY2_MARPO|nr:hypothetical protein AXG93_3545s1260 [Marchantia polymorpha subsp. ruderalis]PTQ36248.1 hypothetical protein MARPO_0065s0058 [Marchantia polymorpha]BBM99708.1 hypothetical protein Mp_1g23200 [Marchantia polymorpha subsp. ruderalis]|eukprot:PTQ36248.1 hypothetical protein MARPO_0065s0058 [Marchantia polymorpha]
MSSLIQKAKEMAVDKLSQVPKPSCELSDLDFKDVSRKNVTMAGIVSITNPYDHDLPVVTITYKIFSNNREIGSGQLTDPGDIKALDKTNIELPTVVPYDFLWNLMKDVGADWDIDYKFEVGVQFKLPIVGKFTLPLETSGTMKLPTLSDMF